MASSSGRRTPGLVRTSMDAHFLVCRTSSDHDPEERFRSQRDATCTRIHGAHMEGGCWFVARARCRGAERKLVTRRHEGHQGLVASSSNVCDAVGHERAPRCSDQGGGRASFQAVGARLRHRCPRLRRWSRGQDHCVEGCVLWLEVRDYTWIVQSRCAALVCETPSASFRLPMWTGLRSDMVPEAWCF